MPDIRCVSSCLLSLPAGEQQQQEGVEWDDGGAAGRSGRHDRRSPHHQQRACSVHRVLQTLQIPGAHHSRQEGQQTEVMQLDWCSHSFQSLKSRWAQREQSSRLYQWSHSFSRTQSCWQQMCRSVDRLPGSAPSEPGLVHTNRFKTHGGESPLLSEHVLSTFSHQYSGNWPSSQPVMGAAR